MNYQIREYENSDLDEIRWIILHGENFGEPFLKSELERIEFYQKSPRLGKIIVAYHNESKQIIGFAAIEYHWRSIVIKSIITHQEFLRQGVGKCLINGIVKIGKNKPNVQVIRVDTGDFMIYAQKFYLSSGFQVSGYVSHDLSWFNHQVHFVYPIKENIPNFDGD